MDDDSSLHLQCNEGPCASGHASASSDGPFTDGYRPGLSMGQLVEQVRGLLGEQRRAERLVCRYLADLADRIEDRKRELCGLWGFGSGFVDVYEAARSLFGMTARQARERVRVGRALRSLPHIEQALLDGTLAYGRVREITRVATVETERKWLRLGQELSFSTLERRVVEAGTCAAGESSDAAGKGLSRAAAEGLCAATAGEAGASVGPARQKTAEPACVRWVSPSTVELRMVLRAEEWAIVQRAMEGAKRAASEDGLIPDGEALAAIAKEALAHQMNQEPKDVHRTVVLYECRHCQRLEVETGAGGVELDHAVAKMLGCGAVERDLRSEGRIVRRGGPVPSSLRRAVHLRDRAHCRVPGCTRRRYVDVHHIHEQARGGKHSRHNCLILCDNHHTKVHAGELILSGDAEGKVEFRDASGQCIGSSLPPTAADMASDAPSALTRAGSSASGDAPSAPTRAGSSASGDALGSLTRAGSSSEAQVERSDTNGMDLNCARVLAVMGNRGGWNLDSLVEASGLPVQIVLQAKCMLELQGKWGAIAF